MKATLLMIAFMATTQLAWGNDTIYDSPSSYGGYNNTYESQTDSSSSSDFSGIGINAGQGRRAAERANSLGRDSYTADDFRGMGMSRGEARRAAERANGGW